MVRVADDELVTGYPYGTLGRDEDYESGFAFADARMEFARDVGTDTTFDGGELRFDPLFEGSRVVGVLASLATEPGALTPFVASGDRGRGVGALALELLDERDADLLALPGSPLETYALQRGFSSPTPAGRLVRLSPPRRARRSIHGASIALVCAPTYSVLLGRRMLEPLKGHLAFPGGKVEPGESALEAARRELFEEVGLRAERPPSFETRVYGGAGEGAVFALDCFVIRVDEPIEPVASAEMEAFWVRVDDSQTLRPMAPGTQRVLRRLRRRFSSLA